jgi:hypothetical protein
MTRPAYTTEPRSSAFSMWLRQHLKPSEAGLSFGDLDFVFEEYLARRALLLEVKADGHHTWPSGIRKTHGLVDAGLRLGLGLLQYDYYGYYLLQLHDSVPSRSSPIWLNGRRVSLDELIAHLNFHKQAAPGFVFSQRYKTWHDGDGHPIVQARINGSIVWKPSRIRIASLAQDHLETTRVVRALASLCIPALRDRRTAKACQRAAPIATNDVERLALRALERDGR